MLYVYTYWCKCACETLFLFQFLRLFPFFAVCWLMTLGSESRCHSVSFSDSELISPCRHIFRGKWPFVSKHPVWSYANTCKYTRLHMQTRTHANAHKHTHVHTHTRTHAHPHPHTTQAHTHTRNTVRSETAPRRKGKEGKERAREMKRGGARKGNREKMCLYAYLREEKKKRECVCVYVCMYVFKCTCVCAFVCVCLHGCVCIEPPFRWQQFFRALPLDLFRSSKFLIYTRTHTCGGFHSQHFNVTSQQTKKTIYYCFSSHIFIFMYARIRTSYHIKHTYSLDVRLHQRKINCNCVVSVFI